MLRRGPPAKKHSWDFSIFLGTNAALGAIPLTIFTIYDDEMIFGHLSPPVADAGSHGHRWREITTKVTDVTNNK